MGVCVYQLCVCVCVHDREREREREKEGGGERREEKRKRISLISRLFLCFLLLGEGCPGYWRKYFEILIMLLIISLPTGCGHSQREGGSSRDWCSS